MLESPFHLSRDGLANRSRVGHNDSISYRLSAVTIVPIGSPVATRLKLPGTLRLKTTRGKWLSMQRLMAVASMTLRFWFKIERKEISVYFLAEGFFIGSAS